MAGSEKISALFISTLIHTMSIETVCSLSKRIYPIQV